MVRIQTRSGAFTDVGVCVYVRVTAGRASLYIYLISTHCVLSTLQNITTQLIARHTFGQLLPALLERALARLVDGEDAPRAALLVHQLLVGLLHLHCVCVRRGGGVVSDICICMFIYASYICSTRLAYTYIYIIYIQRTSSKASRACSTFSRHLSGCTSVDSLR